MSFNISPNTGFFLQNERPSLTSTVRTDYISVKLYPQWFKQISVSWSVPASWGSVLFNVYYSAVSDSGFQKINATPIDGNYFTDTSNTDWLQLNESYYVVEAMLMDKGGVAIRSKPVTWENQRRDYIELRAVEMNRREYLLLSRFTGQKTWLFRKKTFGTRCPTCWDSKLEKIFRDNCPDCYGTSFQGGFFNAAPFYMQIDPDSDNVIRGEFGKASPNVRSAWTIAVPEVHVEDIIITDGFWQAYRVESVSPTQLQGQNVRQIFSMRVLVKSDVEYQLIGRGLPTFPGQFFSTQPALPNEPTSP